MTENTYNDNKSGSQDWTFLLLEGFKGHVVPTKLLPQLMTDLRSRAPAKEFNEIPVNQRFVDEWGIDLPGMMMADRGYEHIPVTGLDLEVPYNDMRILMGLLERAEPRKFADGTTYYKWHGWMHCIVLTQEQRDVALAHMRTRDDAVNALANLESQEFTRRIAEVNKVSPVKIVHVDTVKNDPIPAGTLLSGTPSRERN